MTKLDLLYDALVGVTFYRDVNDYDKLYAEFKNNDQKKEFVFLDSESFKSFLFAKMNELSDDVTLDTKAAIKMVRMILYHDKSYLTTEVFVRTAGDLNSTIEYDLQNKNQTTVKISANGWEISEKKRKFVRSAVNLSQMTPIHTKKTPLELLKPLVNLDGDFFILFVVWLIQAFSVGNHHAMLVFAERGSGKSTLSKMVKQLVDPCKFSVTTIPTKTDNLHTLLYNTSLVCFDNVSRISHEVSDIFCGAVTGTAIPKRSLYTNNDLNVISLRNTILINGIGVVPERDDLAERMLFMKLNKLKNNEIELERDIWSEFENKLPEILGAVFNTLSKAMHLIDTIDTNNLPRMADSYVEMAAIAKALGIDETEFRRIYDNNKRELEQARLGSPVVTAVREYMSAVTGRKVRGNSSEIYAQIYDAFSGDKSLLPNSSSHFSKVLDKEHANLLKSGFRVNIDDTGAKGTEITIIKKK